MAGDDDSGRDDDPHPASPADGASAVDPTAVHETTATEDGVSGTDGTQRHEVPEAPEPWQPRPAAGAGTPAPPWHPGAPGPGTGEFPAPPGPAAGPAFGTPPATGGAGPWGTAAFAGPGGPGGHPPPGYGPPAGPGGPGSPPGYTGPFGPPPPGADGSRSGRTGLVVGIAAIVAVLLVVVTVLLVTRESSPSATLEASVADLRGWEGATYRGRVPDARGATADLVITVDRAGNAAGTVTRDGGGRAEFVLAGREQAIRGDRAWWERSAPRPELADRLTDQWLSDAFIILPRGLRSWEQPPSSLADRLAATDVAEQDGVVVGGRDARVLTPGTDGRRVTVVDDEPPTLVAFDLPGFGSGRLSPVTVDRADPAALQNVRTLAQQAPTMKSYLVAVTERPRLALTVEGGESTCRAPTCTITVRLVNTGTLATSGTVVVTLNGAEVARHPFTSAPGSNLTFPTTAANPVYDRPGASISALWRARVEGGR